MESHVCVLLHRLWCASPGEISLARVAWRRNAARGDRLESRGLPEEAQEAFLGEEGSKTAVALVHGTVLFEVVAEEARGLHVHTHGTEDLSWHQLYSSLVHFKFR